MLPLVASALLTSAAGRCHPTHRGPLPGCGARGGPRYAGVEPARRAERALRRAAAGRLRPAAASGAAAGPVGGAGPLPPPIAPRRGPLPLRRVRRAQPRGHAAAYGGLPTVHPSDVHRARPRGVTVAAGPYPAVVLVHGGGSRKELHRWAAESLAEAGYLVVVPDVDVTGGEGDHATDAQDVVNWLFSARFPHVARPGPHPRWHRRSLPGCLDRKPARAAGPPPEGDRRVGQPHGAEPRPVGR